MQLKPMPHYFIIKINIEEQKQRREKIGSLYVHTSHVFMQRNMQCGEVVGIGSIASSQFPEVEVGHTLIFHHFTEGTERDRSNFIYSDGTFNFYNVTAREYNGHRNECYGVYNGQTIIPNKEFIFAEPQSKETEISADEFIEKNTTQIGSLILFTNWTESRESKEQRAKQITEEIKNMSKAKTLSDSTKRGLEEKQNEAAAITASLSKSEYTQFNVSYSHPSLQTKKTVYALNAAPVELEFMDKTYLIINTKYCVGTI